MGRHRVKGSLRALTGAVDIGDGSATDLVLV